MVRPTRELGPRPILTYGLGGTIAGSGVDTGINAVSDGTVTVDPAASLLVPAGGVTDNGGEQAELFYETSRGGERSQYLYIAASGSTEEFDLSLYNTFDITLTADCTYTFINPPPSGVDAQWTFVRRQGTGAPNLETWPAAVDWQDTDGTGGGPAPTLYTTLGAVDIAVLTTFDGGASYGGSYPSAGTGGGVTVEDEGTPLATTATTLDFVGAGVTASGTGAEKTITIPGGSGITIQDEGTPLSTAATTLDFVGSGVTASGTGATKTITITSGTGPGTELDYVEITSPVSITATTEATANTVVTSSSVSYDGSTTVMIEFRTVANTSFVSSQYLARRLTPSNASHTYSVRATTTSGTSTVDAGAGGNGATAPAFIRITTV
jgi:hypothetical protein